MEKQGQLSAVTYCMINKKEVYFIDTIETMQKSENLMLECSVWPLMLLLSTHTVNSVIFFEVALKSYRSFSLSFFV